LFQTNPRFSTTPYTVRSTVPFLIFQQFVASLTGPPISITSENSSDLLALAEEFGFQDLFLI
jgi:hypothetical protein